MEASNSQYTLSSEISVFFPCENYDCAREFSSQSALSYHLRSCKSGKKRLQGALSRAKDIWESRKKARITLGSIRSLSKVRTSTVHTPTTTNSIDQAATIDGNPIGTEAPPPSNNAIEPAIVSDVSESLAN